MLDFVCVGPEKTATTWLDAVLRRHEAVGLPSPMKETFFFDRHFDKGWSWYERCFPHQARLFRGEVAPSYFRNAQALGRVVAACPRAKIVISLRDPVSRAFSHFRHHFRKGRVPPSFGNAVEKFPEILEAGRYSVWAPRWEARAESGNVYYVVQDDVAETPGDVWQRLTDFLELPVCELPETGSARIYEGSAPRSRLAAFVLSEASHIFHGFGLHGLVDRARRSHLRGLMRGGAEPLALDAQLVAELRDFYRADVEWVEERLGRRLPWPSLPG